MMLRISFKIRERRGSALLVSMLITGLLVSVSLILSTLIFRESRITLDLLNATKAYYAAEAGVEASLYGLSHNLPGWQPTSDDGYAILPVGDAVTEYRVDNRCNAFPCFEGNVNPALVPLDKLYYQLDWNETVQLPLFVYDQEAGLQGVEDFTVEFYSNLSGDDLAFREREGFGVDSLDVLRWKIFGVKERGDSAFTEAISDFTAVSQLRLNNELANTNAEEPSWFGTIICDEFPEDGRYNLAVKCRQYSNEDAQLVYVDGQEAQVTEGTCGHFSVKEYYDYQVDPETGQQYLEEENILPCYPIKDFLRGHSLNYLSFTNLINREVFRQTVAGQLGLTLDEIEAKLKLYVRVEFGNSQTVREFAAIESNGYFNDSSRSLGVELRRGSVVPVFNFALFSTGGEEGDE